MKFIKIPGKSYEMMDAPVTQKQWTKVMGINPSYFKNKLNNPVESVSWNDVQSFISKLNGKDKKFIYELPTEEEWEYCCRAGSQGDYYFGNDEKLLKKYAWYNENSKESTHPVKKKLPNKFGLYDMHGNVWEWTSSVWSKGSSFRVFRGGGWGSVPQNLRSANRNNDDPGSSNSNVGFRLARTLCNSERFAPVSLDKAALSEAVGEVQAALDKIKELLK